MKLQWLAKSENPTTALYLETIQPGRTAHWKWTPQRAKARRFMERKTAAKYGIPEAVRVKTK